MCHVPIFFIDFVGLTVGSREDLLNDPEDDHLENVKGGGSNYQEDTSKEKPTYSQVSNLQDYSKFSDHKLAEGTS